MAALITLLLTWGAAAPAIAWHNGVGLGDGFGTHDWALYEADRLVRSQGYMWLDLAVAQRVCDDPDTLLGDYQHHTYDIWGTPEGDAPAYIAALYDQAVAQRTAGDVTGASESVGLLSHYLTDACDPLHTDESAVESTFSTAYEKAASSYTDVAGENRAWLTAARVNYVYDVEARVIEAATISHADYATLVERYPTTKMDPTALAIVRRSLVRGVDLLADVIASVDADARRVMLGVERTCGPDRWSTAAAISRASYSAETTTVVVASGTAFPDALAGAPLAALHGAPLLLVSRSSIPAATLSELERLAPERVVVLGGEPAIGPEVFSQLAALPGVIEVSRVAGADRYETAAAVSAEVFGAGATSGSVFVTTGVNFPDALAAAPVAAFTGSPVLLTRPEGLPRATSEALDALRPTTAYLLGSTAAVSAEVESALRARGIEVERLEGADRYGTAAAIDRLAVRLGMSLDSPAVASGVAFPDALAAGPALGREGRVLLLASPVRMPGPTQDVLMEHRSEATTITLLGSEVALSQLVAFDAHSAVDPVPMPEVVMPEWRPCSFSESAAYGHAAALAAIGPRVAGTKGEHRGFDYITAQLRSFGYAVTTQSFLLPNGLTTHNVIAEKTGAEPRFIVLGAHVDTKYPSPGANDNGSGVGTVLELARAFSMTETTPSLRFVFFGAEEMLDPDPSHHHYGSGHYVTSLSAAQKAAISGMVSVDMVGYGTDYHARTMLVGPQSMSTLSIAVAKREGIKISFLKDPGVYGWSDHEPFERNGIPAVWLEWRDDPVYHTTADKASHLDRRCIKIAGDHLAGLVLGMAPGDMP